MRKGEKRTAATTTFKAVKLPTGEQTFVPADLHILIPKARKIAPAERHFLAYLPWEKRYFEHIPEQYRGFFTYVLPSLHARTSNVHTALSIAQLPHLLKDFERPVNERLVYLALILHDCGWSQVNQPSLVASFNYNGVTPTGSDSMKAKQQHLVYGEALAYKLLDTFDFGNDPLHSDDIYAISEIIRRHDHDAAWEQDKYGYIRPEIKVMCDSDRLWSYTYENFWLDTVRKGVPPEAYLENITAEIATYFMTQPGKARARRLIRQRKAEVACYAAVMNNAELRASLIARTNRNPSRRLVYRTRQLALSAKSRRMQHAIIRENAY